MSVESVVIAIDGESKCGKTTVIEAIAAEARYQDSIVPEQVTAEASEWASVLTEASRQDIEALHEASRFTTVTSISAGNTFRAATLYVALLECQGQAKTEFAKDDASMIQAILGEEGIEEVLQTDSNIGRRVSEIGVFPGIHPVCSKLICDTVVEAYHQGDGRNLVIVDARDPVGHIERNGGLGEGPKQVNPGHILPIYIDTPTEVAAARMNGDYQSNLEIVHLRRTLDTTRTEQPVVRPEAMVDDVSDWVGQFWANRMGVALPLRLDNHAQVTLENIQWVASLIAAAAQDVAITRDWDFS